MTHRGGLSLSIIICRIGGGGPSFLLPGAQQFSWRPCIELGILYLYLYVVESLLGYETTGRERNQSHMGHTKIHVKKQKQKKTKIYLWRYHTSDRPLVDV